jgi:hypothetical protein
MRYKHEWTLLGHYNLIEFQSIKVPKEPTVGISARIPHTTLYVIMLDYDNIKDERLDEELVYLQELYKLGDFHILKTNEFGRHVVCIDELKLIESLDVMYDSTCDFLFQRGIRINEYRTWILRVLEKGERDRPKYLRTIESSHNGKRVQSQAHGEFLQKFFGINVRLVKPDGNHELEMQRYKTSSKVAVKDLLKR